MGDGEGGGKREGVEAGVRRWVGEDGGDTPGGRGRGEVRGQRDSWIKIKNKKTCGNVLLSPIDQQSQKTSKQSVGSSCGPNDSYLFLRSFLSKSAPTV